MFIFPTSIFKLICLQPTSKTHRHLLAEYLRHVERLDPSYIPDYAVGTDYDPLEEMHDWTLGPFPLIFQTFAPLDANRTYTLKDCLFAEKFNYTLVMVEGSMTP